MNRRFALAVALWSACLATEAQGPNEGFVMEAEAIQHQRIHPDPVYPPIAKAVHVEGTVVLHLDVDMTGKVVKVEVIGGPEMLRGAAVEVARNYSYTPFLVEGKPTPARVVVSVPFSLGLPSETEKSDLAIGQAYFPQAELCRAALSAQLWSDAVSRCKDLVTIAERFPTPLTRSNEIRGAYQEYGTALFDAGDAASSLVPLQKAISIARTSLSPTDAEYASVFFSQALAEHALKLYEKAEIDYATAEDSYRKAIISLPSMTKEYSYSLSRTLAFHSVLESQTNHRVEMQKLARQALQLNPKAFQGITEEPK